MSNEIFPQLRGLTWGGIKKPFWSTKIHETTSGKETRSAYWSYPKWGFTLVYEFLDDSERSQDLRTLAGFFLARKGSFDSFLYRDDTDYYVNGQLLGIGDNARTQFQLIRSFGDFDEPMKKVEGVVYTAIEVVGGIPALPLPPNSPVIRVNEALAADYTINTSGLVTFTTPPSIGAVVSADFSYYFRCRFVNDETEFTQFMYNLWELQTLEMVTVK